MTRGAKIAGIILAGGASRRMGTPKALLRFQNETFLDRLIGVFSPVCDPVIVVVGLHADQIRAGIERADDVRFAVNPDPERGMLSSLQCGLALLPSGSGRSHVSSGRSSAHRMCPRSKHWPHDSRPIKRRSSCQPTRASTAIRFASHVR